MASTLFDTIRGQLQSPGSNSQPAPIADQTKQTQNLLRAKLGKASSTGGGAPRLSNIGERVANQQTQLGMQQLGQQGQQQAQQQQQQQLGQQAQEQQQLAQIADKQKTMNQQFSQETENTLQEFSRGKLKLSDQKDASKMEQLGFNLRLQDQNYIDALQNDGAMKRLNNANDFKIEQAQSMFDNNETLVKMGLDSRAAANADDRVFDQALAQMDINKAITMFNDEQKAAKKAAPYTMLNSLVSAGAGAAANQGGKQ